LQEVKKQMLKYCGVLVLSIILAISSAGCGMGNNNVKTNEYQGRSANRLITQDLGQNRAQVRTYATYNKRVSDKITTDILAVNGVRKATVIVYNRNAIVGIDVRNGQNTATLEHKVARTVKNSDPGYDVHVTADKKLHTRIVNIRNQMVLHPNRDFSGDIRTLIQDIRLKVTAPTPTPTPTPRPKHWHAPTPTPTPKHWHAPTPTPTPTPRPKHNH
jgi:YhcN/YlaJ family sporulation lipoprotein